MLVVNDILISKRRFPLQMELSSKIKAVDNVIDMLTGIIGDTRPTIPSIDNAEEIERLMSKDKQKSRSISKEKVVEKKKSEKVKTFVCKRD